MFEGFQTALKDTFSYLIGILIDGAKQYKPQRTFNIKGFLFVWPFVIALIVALYLLVRVFIIE